MYLNIYEGTNCTFITGSLWWKLHEWCQSDRSKSINKQNKQLRNEYLKEYHEKGEQKEALFIK